jgi:hypothetical protein
MFHQTQNNITVMTITVAVTTYYITITLAQEMLKINS